jgi:hypothetical protein
MNAEIAELGQQELSFLADLHENKEAEWVYKSTTNPLNPEEPLYLELWRSRTGQEERLALHWTHGSHQVFIRGRASWADDWSEWRERLPRPTSGDPCGR